MRHPVAFREFWTPKVSRRGYWHRYTFSPVMLASATGDTSLPAGRGSGKSYGVLEQELVKCGVNRPGEETLLTSLRRIHIQDRMERAIDYFESVPFLKLFLKRILRSPAYMIELNNGHTIHGICVDLTAITLDPRTGELRELRNVVPGDAALSCTGKGAINAVPVDGVIHSGAKDVVRVETASGRSLHTTPEHLLLTDEGWLPAEQCSGKRIAVAGAIPEPAEPARMPYEQIDLLAILLAEGALTTITTEFFNLDEEVVSRATAGAQAIGCRIRPTRTKRYLRGRYTIGPHQRLWDWLVGCGVQAAKSPSREIPRCVFSLDRDGLSRFLSMLWMTDGFVNPLNGPGLEMASEALVRHVQHLLLRFGIHSSVRYRPTGKGKYGNQLHAWGLFVYSESWERFGLSIPLWGDRARKMTVLIRKPHRANGSGWPRSDAVISAMLVGWGTIRKRIRTERLRRAWEPASDRSRGHLLPTAQRLRGPERLRFMRTANPERIRAWAEAAGLTHAMLPFWTASDIWWDPVTRISPAGKKDVGDLSLPLSRNFVVNDIVVHNSVGDDPEAKMAQGKHASKLIVEESQQYPLRAWMKLQGAKDPRGCEILTAGVPDGRLDTPFRKADTVYDSFAGRRFRISRRMDPYFDQKTRKSFIDTLGPEDSDLFRQEVDAEWGNPVWSAWDLDAIYRCMEEKFPGETVPLRLVLEISGKLYREQKLTPTVAIADLPGLSRSMPVRIAMDVGYSQPSEIGVFAFWNDRWWMIARIRLVNRMEHNDQAAVLMEIARRYEADRVGIDTTEGEGRAIAQELELGGWSGRIDRYSGNENILSGYTIERDIDGQPTGGIVELVEIMRSAATRRLREGFSKREYALPKDEDIAAEFNQEVEARSSDGVTRVLTPPTVHVSDMCRVFAIMQLIAAPPIPPQQDDSGAEVVLPEWGVGTGWRR